MSYFLRKPKYDFVGQLKLCKAVQKRKSGLQHQKQLQAIQGQIKTLEETLCLDRLCDKP